MGGQLHARAALPPGNTRFALYRRLGRPQGRSGRVRKISPPPGFDPRTVQSVARCYTDCAGDWQGPCEKKAGLSTRNSSRSVAFQMISGSETRWIAVFGYYRMKELWKRVADMRWRKMLLLLHLIIPVSTSTYISAQPVPRHSNLQNLFGAENFLYWHNHRLTWLSNLLRHAWRLHWIAPNHRESGHRELCTENVHTPSVCSLNLPTTLNNRHYSAESHILSRKWKSLRGVHKTAKSDY